MPRSLVPPVAPPDGGTLRTLLRRYRHAGEPLACEPLTEGLLNHGYRLSTSRGHFFLKHHLDGDRAAIARQHAATQRLGALGLPVAPPVAAEDGSTVAVLGGRCYALHPWVEGRHRDGGELTTAQSRGLGALLGTVHVSLETVMREVAGPGDAGTWDSAGAGGRAAGAGGGGRAAGSGALTGAGAGVTSYARAGGGAGARNGTLTAARAAAGARRGEGPGLRLGAGVPYGPGAALVPAAAPAGSGLLVAPGRRPAGLRGAPPGAGVRLAPESAPEGPQGAPKGTAHAPDPRGTPDTLDVAADPEDTYALIEELLVLVRRGPRDSFDELAEHRLLERRALLERHAHRRPPPAATPARGWVHGDFHPLNLLYRDAEPAAIVDWDRLGVRPRAEEAVRAAVIFFLRPDGTLDFAKIRPYARAYRRTTGAGPEELAAAVHRVWWERLNDFWMLRWRYQLGDHRADPGFPASAALAVWWTGAYEDVRDAFTD
ncbi:MULTISPECIES: phosphotransferase [Streptomyces]|uniref:phosphotransferase n=1 Tax=Streptomyces TaxID=1883 RepID=UPI00163BC780|nr:MULTISPECIES: phosphotransferase [Streptomyces]MBC2873637.1 phosphotransferase [Streptomyces sp. TYQ1024]UBI37929.1 phosphotransferase [Streptomyces mobaraensis]UKW30515.1 phosphotransferase [Streptomyces sp. TYQ1024]